MKLDRFKKHGGSCSSRLLNLEGLVNVCPSLRSEKLISENLKGLGYEI